MKVTLINRKPRKLGNYSIESYFKAVFKVLAEKINCNYFVSSEESNGIFQRIRAIKEVKKIDADVYHITGDVHFLALGTPGSKSILTIHDCGFMNTRNKLKRLFLLWFWLVLPVKRVKVVTCVSQATKDEIVKFTGCNPDKIWVIPTTVSENFKRTEKDFNDKKPRILQIGTKFNKNVSRLIEALEGIDCHLVIVGELRQALRDRLQELGIEYENLVDISDKELMDEYIKADLIAFASTLEGFGMPIVEAQRIGRVVLTSNCSSMPEVAGGAAELVDPLDVNSIRKGIINLIGNSELRRNYIEQGFSNTKRFDTGVVADQYIACYQRIIQ